MGKHDLNYARIDKDRYQTPKWPVVAVCEHIDIRGKRLWEPFCGEGQMSDALFELGASQVYSTDIEDCGYKTFTGEHDFLSDAPLPVGLNHIDGIFSNPPFGDRTSKLAEKIIARGLEMLKGSSRFMILLLPADYDAASTRADLFDDCPAFAGKVTLRKRIKWFDKPVPCKACAGIGKINDLKCVPCKGAGSKMVGPKENHAWYAWQYPLLMGQQTKRIMYAPSKAKVAA